MDRLLNGYRRFRRDRWPERRQQFETLADTGQRPRALVVSCADSRVDPGMIFDAGPGELFVVRNVANLVPPFAPDKAYHGTSAALEFAVRILEVPDILVMGHAMCGGVRALLEGAPAGASDLSLRGSGSRQRPAIGRWCGRISSTDNFAVNRKRSGCHWRTC